MTGPTVVVLPTYQEAENVERMLEALREVLGTGGSVLVVDDGSPDGTGALAEAFGAAHGGVRVLHRAVKEGLGPAYVAGFRAALDLGAARIVQMDCDFSHDPADVPRLVAATAGADLAIGSRYVRGGRVENWPLHRLALSRAGSLYARGVLGVGVRDLTGGFKCWRREVLEALDLSALRLSGYGFQVELTYRALAAGFSAAEVPIRFTDRCAGASKMSGDIVFEALRAIPTLRFGEHGEALPA
jgi:dolichol-phosphate mannosyltransferase